MYHQKGGCNVSFILKKIKKQNAYPCKFQKKLKVSSFHCHKCVDQKYLWRSRNYQEPSKSIIRFLTIVFRNLGKGKRQKVKSSIFDGSLIINQSFSQSDWICYWQIKLCTYHAFLLNQMSDIRDRWTKKLQTFSRHFLWKQSLKYLLPSYCYFFVLVIKLI